MDHDIERADIASERAEYLARDYSRGFIAFCGFRAEEIRRGFFRSRVDIRDAHRQQDGFIHAGVMATMADHTAGYAAFTIVPEDYQILTIEFKINFLRPGYGEGLECISRVIREGSGILVAESEVHDLRGRERALTAKAMVTLAAVHRDRLRSEHG
ncbi:MAG: PaaI family thioesterase [Desulfobacteraceae bacterium]